METKGGKMELTKEIAQKQLEAVKGNMEGFVQGYAQALTFALQVIDTKESTPNEAPKQ